MEVSAIAVQQAQSQLNASAAMLKKNAQAEQALINIIAESQQSAPTGGRGQNLDILA